MASKILFMGSPEAAVPSLKALLEEKDAVLGVVSQPDRPAGRGQGLTSPPVALLAREKKIPLFQPDRIRDNQGFFKTLKELAPDLIVVAAYGRLLPREVLELTPGRCLNVHFSLLPKYRGAAPVQWALINGETESGVTIMQIVERLDAGPILSQKKVLIEPEDNAEILGHRLATVGADLLRETIDRLKDGTIEPIPQNDRLATLAPPLKKEDGRIDWTKKARTIFCQIRGMTPWPGAFTQLDKKLLKIYSTEVIARRREAVPGEILSVSPEGIEIACGQEALLIKEVQLEGKKKMPVSEFLKGHPLERGQRL